MKLLQINQMPSITGVEIPKNFYWVLKEPAPLAGMKYPEFSAETWRQLKQKGFDTIVNLTENHPSYDPTPLSFASLIQLQDMEDDGVPDDLNREVKFINDTAHTALQYLKEGQGVLVHCIGGTGRTGTVIGVILRLLGFSSRETLEYLNRLSLERKRKPWPKAAWRAEIIQNIPHPDLLN